MTEELQHTLSSLAESLGITVGELWSWLQSDGIEAYSRAVIANLWVKVIFELLAVIVLIAITAFFLRDHFARMESERFYDGESMIATIIFVVFAVFGLLALMVSCSELAGWMASPEGMVISTILGRR